MVILCILLISTFTFIQLNNQLNNLTQQNSYQANLSSIIAKNNLETVLRKINTLSDIPKYLQLSLNALIESKVINKATIFDKNGSIVASSEEQLIGQTSSFKDQVKWQDLQEAESNRWFTSDINSLKRELNIFIALKTAATEPILYLAKLTFSLGNIQEAFSGIYRTIILATIIILLANIILGYILSKTVVGPIKLLNDVTKMIAGGDLRIRTKINTGDELQELGQTFNHMTEELIKMKERAENANPLTKLPGNIIIQEQVEIRISNNQPFVVIYSDLDNFKAFNDKYGISQGDEAIKLTATILKESMTQQGTLNDFLGHEGGDDFILLTVPEKATPITDFITQEFNTRVRNLYSKEDLELGHIVAHARDGSIKEFPIMTISLAGVTNEHRKINSYAEVTNIAAEVKKKAKSIGGSVFVLDKRTS